MSVSFIHLHVHSEYSLVNGIVRIHDLVRAAAEAGMPAVALTDQSNMFAMVKFYKAALAAGIKPLLGADLFVHDGNATERPHRLVLLCQNQQGYLNLSRLITRSYTEGQMRGLPTLRKGWLEGQTDGLIALSGGRYGEIARALMGGQQGQAESLVHGWQALFPDRFYLELSRTGREGEEHYISQAVELALATNTPVVATNEVHFLRREDFEAHEARVCIHEGRTLDDPRRPRDFSEDQYLRSPDEMAALFADLPEALDNSVEITRRCNLALELGQPALPDFPIPEGRSVDGHLRAEAQAGLERRLAELFDTADADFAARRQAYDERLARELDVIVQMGFPGYFLIVADFIRWAKHHGIPVGPGRGSGAGSLVAFALDITNLDPIRYDLLFERFLNPERVSMPDFDVDFCMERRDDVIDYVVERYGREKVSQIITHGTMAAKAVVRDVGRVLGYPFGFVDKLAKLIPLDLGITLDKALKEEDLKRRYDSEEEVRTLIDLGRKLEGLVRNAGKHAGGVVIGRTALTDVVPLYCEPGGESAVTQLDKDDVEQVGLVKFDFLGLRTLTIIDWAVSAVNAERAEQGLAAVNIDQINLQDPTAFKLLKDCGTTAVFQLESQGMKDLIKRLQPDSFEDIIALVALFRPGPLQSGMVDDFINRKHKRIEIQYPHPDLAPVLKSTYGVILYQEQVMQIAQVLAGYSLGAADLLRRAMGKKKPEEMAKQRTIFMEGARARGVDEAKATTIFDLMEKFAGYGFNKSHSAAYALVSYQTAWLKAHYPAHYMAAVLSADMHNTDKVVRLIDECRAMGLHVLPPDANTCGTAFTAQGADTILYGLGAIKGVGTAAIDSMVSQRSENGPFQDLFDLCRRVDLRKFNRRILEALIRAGALDSLGPNRATLMASVSAALQAGEQHHRNNAMGQDDLFNAMMVAGDAAAIRADNSARGGAGEFIHSAEWSEEERLQAEKETLGLYLTGHPISRYEGELGQFLTARLAELQPNRNQTVTVAGLVVAIRTRASRRGDRMAFVTLDDRTGRIELAVFPEVYRHYRALLASDKLLVVEGTVTVDDYAGGFKMSADRLLNMDQAREAFAQRLEISVDTEVAANGFREGLAAALDPHRQGHCPVYLDYQGQGARAQLVLGQSWQVQPCDELLDRLSQIVGPDRWRLVYGPALKALQ